MHPRIIYNFWNGSTGRHQLSCRIKPWRQSDVPKITGRHIGARTWCSEARGPFRTTFITKCSRGNCLEGRNWLKAHCDISRMLVITWTREFGGLHHILWNFNFLANLGCARSMEIRNRIVSFFIEFSDFFISAWGRIIVLGGNVVIMEKVNLVAQRKFDSLCA